MSIKFIPLSNLSVFFFEQAKIEYDISKYVVHLAQGVQKRIIQKCYKVKLLIPLHNKHREKRRNKTSHNMTLIQDKGCRNQSV